MDGDNVRASGSFDADPLRQSPAHSPAKDGSAGAGLSISSLLAASQQLASPETTAAGRSHAAWAPTSSALAQFQDDASLGFERSFGIPSQVDHAQLRMEGIDMMAGGTPSGSMQKRKWGDAGMDEKRDKIRTSIEGNTQGASSEGYIVPTGLTTVLCLHASIAQKSYKSEKRYLCPPPMVRLDGPMRHLAQKPRLVLSVLSETGVRNMSEEASSVDEEMKTYFRGLYVAGTAKAKAISFQLTLHPPGNPLAPPDINSGADETLASGPSFACFDSATVSILSKACKKTAKARNTTGCLLAGSTLSLFNRINSQAVRTKYMTIDAGKFTARTSQWTAFSIHVLRSAEVALPGGAGTLATSKVFNGANTVTYGSQIILTDLMTGISSEPMTIRHVEKNKVHLGATGPVSQLQKIALVRTTATGQDIYLSVEEAGGMDATGVLLSTPQVEQPEEENGTEPGKKKKKGKEVPSPLLAMLTYQYPDQVLSAEENGGVSCHVVKDQMTWTVVGISSFSYSFFDAYANTHSLPTSSITPFPAFSIPPEYNMTGNTISATISHLYHVNSLGSPAALEIWLGPIGPLEVHVVKHGADEQSGTLEPSTDSLVSITLPPPSDIIRLTSSRADPSSPQRMPPNLRNLVHLPSQLSPEAGPSSRHDPPNNSTTTEPTTDFLDRSIAALDHTMHVSASSPYGYATSLPTYNELHSSSPFQAAPPPRVPPSFLTPLPLPSSHLNPHPSPPLNGITTSQPASLPIIFVRPEDGVGYMTGRWLVVEDAPVYGGTERQVRIV